MSIGQKPISLFLLSLVLIITGLFFAITPTVRAAELDPSCSSGVIRDGEELASFKIDIICTNVVKFAHSGTSEADSADLVNIVYQSNNVSYVPIKAIISGNKLTLTLSTIWGSRDRDVNLSAGLLLNNSGVANGQILISTADISDHHQPFVNDDAHFVSTGYPLSVSAAEGVLNNDLDNESTVGEVGLVTAPSFGTLTLSADGSFTYVPSAGFTGIDSFSYLAKDSSGNSNIATVTLTDEAPKVSANLYNKTVIGSGYAKVGDVIRVDVEVNEPIKSINFSKIAEYKIEPQIIDETHFYIEYTMQDGDAEGAISYAIKVSDSVGNPGSSNSEDGVIFDMTAPVIDLGDPPSPSPPPPTIEPDIKPIWPNIRLDTHGSPYVEEAVAKDCHNDDCDLVDLDISGTYDRGKAGVYILTYTATDLAGNQAVATRTITVIDVQAPHYNEVLADFTLFGLVNNIDSANADNYKKFAGLYIEKNVDGVKTGRITFDAPIDLSGDIEGFLYEFIDGDFDRLKVAVGEIGIDMTDAVGDVDYGHLGATIKFYNLDKLGYANYSTKADVFNAITAYDDDGNIIDKSALDYDSAVYVGCGPMQVDCYTFTVKVAHFSKYVISYNSVEPPIEPTIDPSVEPVVDEEVVGARESEIALVSSSTSAYDRTGSTPRSLAQAGYSSQDISSSDDSQSGGSSTEIITPKPSDVNKKDITTKADLSGIWIWWREVLAGLLLTVFVGLIWFCYRNKLYY